jgi:hypothetical protein
MGGDPTNVSPKVTFAALGAAISTIIWTVLGLTVLKDLPEPVLAGLNGATATILAFILGWVVPDPARTGVPVSTSRAEMEGER